MRVNYDGLPCGLPEVLPRVSPEKRLSTPYRLPNWQAVARNVVGRCVAGGSRPEGVDFARIDPPEFFSAPATPFLASRNAATYGDSIILGVAVGPRGNPWGPVGARDP